MTDCEVRGATFLWYNLGVFLKFYYLRVNINILLYNPNLIHNKRFFFVLIDIDNLSNHVKFICYCFHFL